MMIENLDKIQYITRDSDLLTHSEQAKFMFENGVKWVQIRMKGYGKEQILKEALMASDYAKKLNGKLIINDHIDIALKVKAYGIHLGLSDTPVNEARVDLNTRYVIGGTANTLEDILIQWSRGADYIGVGPYSFTETKKNLSPVIGLDGYKNMVKNALEAGVSVPLIAVGGIKIEDIPSILDAGMDGVAISGALLDYFLVEIEGVKSLKKR